MKLRRSLVAAEIVLFVWTGTASAAPAFQGLGFLPGGATRSESSAVSANGSVVVGSSWSLSARRAFRWTAAGGMEDLGTLSGHARSQAYGVSADGSTVVGTSGLLSSIHGDRAFRWTSGSIQDLGTLAGRSRSEAFGISADGSVVVGSCSAKFVEDAGAFRWTQGGGMLGLPITFATAISADGSVVGGGIYDGIASRAYRWTEAGGPQYLGSGSVSALSPEGQIVVGTFRPTETTKASDEAWRWAENRGRQFLYWGHANAMSADGSIVVGAFSNFNSEPVSAVLWTKQLGAVRLNQFLPALGSDLTGWNLLSATGISSDGTTIVGYGRNPSGQTEAWIARIPEPAALPLLALGGCALRHRGHTGRSPVLRVSAIASCSARS